MDPHAIGSIKDLAFNPLPEDPLILFGPFRRRLFSFLSFDDLSDLFESSLTLGSIYIFSIFAEGLASCYSKN